MSYFSEQMYLTKEDKRETNVYYSMFFSDVTGKILEIGCSIGNFVALDPKNIVGVDVDKDAIEIAKKRGLNCAVMDVDREKLDFPSNTFDAINAHAILEHLNHPLEALKEIHRILKPHGKLVLMTADAKKFGHLFWDDYTHKRPYSKESLEHMAYDAGFKDIKISYEHKQITGMGLLVRKNILPVKAAVQFQEFLLKLGISHKGIFLICRKE